MTQSKEPTLSSMQSDSATIKELRMRVRLLEAELKQQEEEGEAVNRAFAGVLTKQELALLMGIIRRPFASYAYLDHITEDNGKYNRYQGEMHQRLRTRVTVWKMRKKLKPYGIQINIWQSMGYYLNDENKAKLKALMEKRDD